MTRSNNGHDQRSAVELQMYPVTVFSILAVDIFA
jgi:hypothetical protein